MPFAKKTYAEALEAAQNRPQRPRTALKQGKGLRQGSGLSGSAGLRRASNGYISAGLRAKPDPELAAWAIRVKKRDGYKCQWEGCVFWHDQLTVYVAHHKALRSARPDLRLVDDNGTTVCWDRHSVIHSPEGREEAIRRGFLNLRSREMAAKENTLGIR